MWLEVRSGIKPENWRPADQGFEHVVDATFGARKYPPAILGDLSDLELTLKQVLGLLVQFRPEPPAWVSRDQLARLERMLTDDLPMIFADRLPAIRKVKKRARYATE